MQKITLVGFLGRDAAVRESKNGKKFISLTVGVNGMFNGTQKSSWYDIMCFNYSENKVPHLKKGSGVIVVGELDADLETGSDGVTRCRRNVMADYITFNSTGKSADGETEKIQQENKSEQQQTPKKETVTKTVVQEAPASDDSDLPF